MAVPIQPDITFTEAPENLTHYIAALTAVMISTDAITDPTILDHLTVTIPVILTGVILESVTDVISAAIVTIPAIPASTDTGTGILTGGVSVTRSLMFTGRTNPFTGTTGDS